MKQTALKEQDYEQIDLFEDTERSRELASSSLFNDHFDPWDNTRGRNIIKALDKNGRDITLVFDALDQQYHLFED